MHMDGLHGLETKYRLPVTLTINYMHYKPIQSSTEDHQCAAVPQNTFVTHIHIYICTQTKLLFLSGLSITSLLISVHYCS